MKVFVDYHHTDLYYSLHRLFEERLGWELYRPTGMEWEKEGFWHLAKFHNHPAFADFMLNPGGVMDEYWIPGWNYYKDGIYYLFEPIHEYFHKAVTLSQFKKMHFDIIVSSTEMHEKPYLELQRLYQPQAKMVAHLGNSNQQTTYKNLMISSQYKTKSNQNFVYVHQELDLSLYKDIPPNPNTKNVFSVVHFHPYKEVYNQYKTLLTDCNFASYGGHCEDGGLYGTRGVSRKMQEANVGWHTKPLGGVGHTSMGWAVSARPVITNMSQHRFAGGEATKLFEPGITCHDIESSTIQENCKIIKRLVDTDDGYKLGKNLKKRFFELVNYDNEEQSVRNFFKRIF